MNDDPTAPNDFAAPSSVPIAAPDLAVWYPNEAAKDAVAAAAAQDATKAPEGEQADGEYKLTAPEGYEITPEILKEVAPVFREAGLSNEHANKLMPLAGKFAARIHQQAHDEFQAAKSDWATASKADPVIGGANWGETTRLVTNALKVAGVGQKSELMSLLNQSGLGNHPAMIRALRIWGWQTGKPTVSTGPKTREQIWYPNH